MSINPEGTCVQENIPEIDMTLVDPLNLMPAGDVHAFVWVYLIIHLFWAISSLTLLTSKDRFEVNKAKESSNTGKLIFQTHVKSMYDTSTFSCIYG